MMNKFPCATIVGCHANKHFSARTEKGGEVGMSMEFVNRICPNCKNPNYMVSLGNFSKAYKYKCMNCNRFFNDIDFEKESLQPVWESECVNSKVDMVEVVRCKDCKWWENGLCKNDDVARKINDCGCYPDFRTNSDWFCADGKRR